MKYKNYEFAFHYMTAQLHCACSPITDETLFPLNGQKSREQIYIYNYLYHIIKSVSVGKTITQLYPYMQSAFHLRSG